MSQEHVLSVRTNVTVFGILLGLLALTVIASIPDLGFFALPVAMIIAVTKAMLILLYFMHVKFSKSLIWVFSGAAFFWLLILLVLTYNDYFARDWLSVLGK